MTTATMAAVRTWPAWRSWDAAANEPGPLHTRRDLPEGGKVVTWERGAHPADLVYFATADNRPPRLGRPLVVVEGEKVADAVARAGYLAAGIVCGAGTQPADAVLGILSGYRLTLSPDNDDDGLRLMETIAERLERAGVAACRWLDPPAGAPPKWDLADVAAPDRRALIEGARDLPMDPAIHWPRVAR